MAHGVCDRRQWRHDRHLAHAAYALRMLVVGHFDEDRFDHRQIGGDRHTVVEETRVIEQSVGREDALLVDGPTDPLGDTALDLPLHIAWMDGSPNILKCGVAHDPNLAGLWVDLNVANVGGKSARGALRVERG